jgi:acylphosphatase
VNAPETAAEIVIEGSVQGVGYRDYARRHAARLGLGGWVMNLHDGRVRIHAEGPRARIQDLLQALEQGPTLSRVQRVAVEWTAPTGQCPDFEIRTTERAW